MSTEIRESGLGLQFFLPGPGEALQLRHQQNAHQRRGKAAVVQAEAAVEVGHRGHQQIVHGTGHNAGGPAVLSRHRAQAVGKAQSHADGLGINGLGEGTARHAGQPGRQQRHQKITHHNGPHVPGMRAGIGGSQHAEDNAHGHAVEGDAHQVVVRQNEQAEHAHIHQEHSVAISAGETGHMYRIGQQLSIIPGFAAQQQGQNHTPAEQDAAEYIHRQPGGHLQLGCVCAVGQGHAQGLEQHGIDEEGHHADGKGGGVQVKALVYLRRERHACRQEKADGDAHHQGNQDSLQIEAHRFRIGVTDHQIRQQWRNAGGEEHGIDHGAELGPLHQAVEHHAQHGGPDVQDVDAPGGESQGQQKRQVGNIIGRGPEDSEQRQADQAHQSDVQEGGRITAYRKIVGGQLAGLADHLPQTPQHLVPVRHAHRRRQECQTDQGKKQPQKIRFREFLYPLHKEHPSIHIADRRRVCKKGDPVLRLDRPDGRHFLSCTSLRYVAFIRQLYRMCHHCMQLGRVCQPQISPGRETGPFFVLFCKEGFYFFLRPDFRGAGPSVFSLRRRPLRS